jgi:hypothetical protein
MSESDDRDQHPRPWDPAGTRPKHDPASLLPQAGDPLLPPDAEVVESDAIDEDGGDLLPERHRPAGAPAVAAAAGGSAYAPRFQFMTGALVAVGIAAIVGITVAIIGIPPKHEGPPWSPWKPTTDGVAGAAQIASHVAPNYRDRGVQLVKVDANDLSYKGVPLLVALRTSAEEGGAIQLHDEKGVLYQLCGLTPTCAIDHGKPTIGRGYLMRREALELALYSFRYLDVKQVVVLIPPLPGRVQTVALYFQRDDVRAELARPLTSSLVPKTPSPKNVKLSRDFSLVHQATGNQYLFTLNGAGFNNGGLLVLQHYTPEADKKLQKQIEAQQKQAAADVASAATQSSSGG